MEALKSTLKFWQEIVFFVLVGLPLTALIKAVILGHTMGGAGIFCLCFLLPLFVCLFGQFFWKNRTLSMILVPPLILYSLFWFFVSFAMPRYIDYEVTNPNNYLRPVIFIGALFLIFAAITMPKKYFKENTTCTSEKVVI
jgi:pimeloyl-ACP methyl ester carboxylesterase